MVPVWLLSGCDDAARAAGAAEKDRAPTMTRGSQQPTLPATTASPASSVPPSVRKLFDEVKRLSAACVSAGGGVSGSPDCDLATVREEELEGLGYCIDYPNDEALTTCSNLGATGRRLETQETRR